ncbi:MAG TPA: hypothetical protein VLV86_12135, partial [Vicinamibacterales bacterium]|nr:hypothetical protein [Vicinamibacterales bacterium]
LVFQRIKATHAGSLEGRPLLITALVASWRRQFAKHHWPLAEVLIHSLFDTLLTPATREMLGIAPLPHTQEEVSRVLMPVLEAGVRISDELFRLLPPTARLAAAVNHFFAVRETDSAEDDSVYNPEKHIRAWSDQVRTLKAE